jgi:hypothetical protein
MKYQRNLGMIEQTSCKQMYYDIKKESAKASGKSRIEKN